jgi:hypothetical protein
VFDYCFVFRAIHRELALSYKATRASPVEHESVLLGLQHHKSKRIWLARPLTKLSMDLSLARLVQTKAVVERAGAELVLFEYESGSGLEAYLSSRGLAYLDLQMPWNPALQHEHNDHYNEEGHRLVGERLFRALQDRGYPR